jgi:anti-sigma regulatory factor (Ser/Thr protein kinase)
MIGGGRLISLQVLVNDGTDESARAVSLGLIVTELVINAPKHAFPKDRQDGRVVISYQFDGPDWKLVVSDNAFRGTRCFTAWKSDPIASTSRSLEAAWGKAVAPPTP